VTLNELENKEKQELKKIFLHFTRKNNQESIEKIGLNPNVKKENAVGNDKEVPVVYFSEGLEGMFEILNTWVRTEYYMNVQLKRRMGIDVKFGHEEVDSDILKEVYEKMYADLKDRIYYSVELKEGIDYEEDGIDDKKVDLKTRLENNDIPEYIVEDVKWQYGDGEYGNFDDIKQEKWNRNTIRGKVIDPEKLTQIISENGSLNALDIMLEKYENYDKTKLENLKELEEFVEYCKERKKEEKEVNTKEDLGDKNKDIRRRLISEVYNKFTDIEQMHIVEKTLENIGSKHYSDDELRSSAFTLETSQYQSRTLEHFEQVFENNRADVDSITEVDLRNLEALLINGVPKAKYYTACYIMSRIGSKGVAERSERAISLLNQAADEGDAQAAAKLADYYYEGRHHEDHDRAYKLYTGIGALALDEKRRENMLGLFNQKLYYNKLLKFTAVLYVLFTLSMVIPFGLGSYKNLTLLGILFSLISLGVLISGFVINKIKPYFNIQFIPATLFIVWFFDILIRLVR